VLDGWETPLSRKRSKGQEALEDLTGAPSTVFNLREMDPTTLFAELLESDRCVSVGPNAPCLNAVMLPLYS
jgi:hypothetical protein